MLDLNSLALIAYYLLMGAFFFGRYTSDKLERSKMQEEAFYCLFCYMAVGMPLVFSVLAKDSPFLIIALAISGLTLLLTIYYAIKSIFGNEAATGMQILLLVGSFAFEIFLALPIRAELERLAWWYFAGALVIGSGSLLVGPLLFMVFPTNTEKLFSRSGKAGKSQVSLEAWALGIGVLYPIWMIVHHLL